MLTLLGYREWVNGRGDALEVFNPATEECEAAESVRAESKLNTFLLSFSDRYGTYGHR